MGTSVASERIGSAVEELIILELESDGIAEVVNDTDG